MTPASALAEMPPAQFSDQITRLIQGACEKSSWSFSCEGVDLTTEEMAAQDGLMPLVLWKAAAALEQVWGHQELVFRCDANALCAVVPDLKRAVLPLSIWLHAVHFVLDRAIEAAPGGPAPLDEWFKDWSAALSDKKVLLLPPKPVSAPSGSSSSGA